MNVTKRDGRQEVVMFDKITARINKLCARARPLSRGAPSASTGTLNGTCVPLRSRTVT